MTDERTRLAEYVYNLGHALHSMACHGNPPRSGELAYKRMSHPRPGDLVVEISGWRKTFDPDAVGRLIRIDGDPKLADRWVIEPLLRPGEEQGWGNAQFVAVPDIDSLDRWSGLYDELEAERSARRAAEEGTQA
ncbi:hypothetical protein OG874_00355 [Nocardia sp. NBC_00565]|uniref:hypothetical protein n=1 Tax=Nocardia sp. NBC_00565 TaxID=2975993 RepID=UPI002E824299|nr:hypothetical protein [Nocardia sp. NBC_00565]WUC03706.1 hypothetical protein OG874_00355 [Nocardia sp. NBC_00565]